MSKINVLDKEILDEHLNYYLQDHHLLEKDFIITDNFTKKVTLSIVYYCKEQIVTEEEFFDNLQKGLSGKIEYQAIDSYGNQSEKIIQNVKVLDDTAPIITINNLKDKEKYLGPITIDYVVTDNLKGLVNVEVLVNGNVYSGEELIDLNQYNLMIVATDEGVTVKELQPMTAAEDFGHYTERYPSLFYRLGVGKAAGGSHTATFLPDEGAIAVGERVMRRLALHILNK